MGHRNLMDIIAFTNTQRVLSFLADDMVKEYLASEIIKATRLSKAGVYRALDELARLRLVRKSQRGRFVLHQLAVNDCFTRQFKVFKNVILLRPLVDLLKGYSREIKLFGSASRAEDYADSDLDLFIVAKDPQAVEGIVAGFKSKRKVQAVIKTASQLAQWEERNQEFVTEIKSGITLWKEFDES